MKHEVNGEDGDRREQVRKRGIGNSSATGVSMMDESITRNLGNRGSHSFVGDEDSECECECVDDEWHADEE